MLKTIGMQYLVRLLRISRLMMPEMQCNSESSVDNLIGKYSIITLSGSSLRKGGGLNFRCASVKSRGLIEALNS